MAMTAKEYLDLVSLYEKTPKDVIAANVNLLFGFDGPMPISSPSNRRTEILCKLTESARYTVLGWMNCGQARKNVRIPLQKLCIIAQTFNVDIQDLLDPESLWYRNDIELQIRLMNKLEELKTSL